MDQTNEPAAGEPDAAKPKCEVAQAAANASDLAEAIDVPSDLNAVQARLAFGIIESLLNHTAVIHDLIALMAQVLDADTVKALTATPQWLAYLDSKRTMERTQTEIEEFTQIMRDLSQS